jgi:hypothetical protein
VTARLSKMRAGGGWDRVLEREGGWTALAMVKGRWGTREEQGVEADGVLEIWSWIRLQSHFQYLERIRYNDADCGGPRFDQFSKSSLPSSTRRRYE